MSIRLQISDSLRRRIESGELQAHSTIPSERALAQQLGVSRMTVRAAVEDMVNEGLLIRRQGRKTVVADRKINRAAGFTSFSEEMRLRGWQPTSAVRQVATLLADVATAAQLELPVGARVILIERLRLADDEPLAQETVYLSYSRFPELAGMDLASCSLYELLASRYGVRPVYAEESVEAVLMTTEQARLFGLERGSPALLSRRITRDETGTVVEAATSLYRGDRYRMVLARRR